MVKLDTDTKIIIAAAAVAGVLLYIGARKAAEQAAEVIEAVTPWNPENVFNQGAVGVYQAVSGSEGSIGSDLYDLLHPAEGEDGVFETYWKAWTGQPNRMGWKLFFYD